MFNFDPKKEFFGGKSLIFLNEDNYDFASGKGMLGELEMGEDEKFIVKVIPYLKEDLPEKPKTSDLKKHDNYKEILWIKKFKEVSDNINLSIYTNILSCRIYDPALSAFPMLEFMDSIHHECHVMITPKYNMPDLNESLKNNLLSEQEINAIFYTVLSTIKEYQDLFKMNMNDLHLKNILLHLLPTKKEYPFYSTDIAPIIWDFELSNSPEIINDLGDIGFGNMPQNGEFIPEYDVHLFCRELYSKIDKNTNLAKFLEANFSLELLTPQSIQFCDSFECFCEDQEQQISEPPMSPHIPIECNTLGKYKQVLSKFMKECEKINEEDEDEYDFARCPRTLLIDHRLRVEWIDKIRNEYKLPTVEKLLESAYKLFIE